MTCNSDPGVALLLLIWKMLSFISKACLEQCPVWFKKCPISHETSMYFTLLGFVKKSLMGDCFT